MASKLEEFVSKWNMSIPSYKLSVQILKNPNKVMMLEALTAVLNMIGVPSNFQQMDAEDSNLSYAVDILNRVRSLWPRISSDANVCLQDIIYPSFKRSVAVLIELHNFALFVKMTKDKVQATVSKTTGSMRERNENRKKNIETIHNTKIEVGKLQSKLERLNVQLPNSEEEQKLRSEEQGIEADLQNCAVTKKKLVEEKRDILEEISELTNANKSLEDLSSDMNLLKRSMGKVKSKLEQGKSDIKLKRLELRTLDQEHKEFEKQVASYETLEEASRQISRDLCLLDSLGEEPEGYSYMKARVFSLENELITEQEKLSKVAKAKKQIALKANMDLKDKKQRIQFLRCKLNELKIGRPVVKCEIEGLIREISAAEDLIKVLSSYPEGIRKKFQATIDLIEQKAQEVEKGAEGGEK